VSAEDGQRLAAGLIAGGIVIAVVAGLTTPPNLYQAADHATSLQIIGAQRARFLIAQVLWAVMLVVPAAGFILLSRQIQSPLALLPSVAALAVGLGASAGILFVALQTVDPLRFWLTGGGVWVSVASAWLTVLAAALFGVAMLASPGWGIAGFVLTAYASVAAVGLLFGGQPFFIIIGFYLAALAPALALWQGRPA
jgi:hypothetical protein